MTNGNTVNGDGEGVSPQGVSAILLGLCLLLHPCPCLYPPLLLLTLLPALLAPASASMLVLVPHLKSRSETSRNLVGAMAVELTGIVRTDLTPGRDALD